MSSLIWIQTVDTLMVFLKYFFKNVDSEKKNTADNKTHEKIGGGGGGGGGGGDKES